MRRTRTRTVVVIAASVATLAAAGVITTVLVSGDPDPNEGTVTKMCREAADVEPVMTEGVDQFTVDELTHENEDGDTFYRATGTASTGDGYGGTRRYTFDCRTKLAGGNRWELLDLTML